MLNFNKNIKIGNRMIGPDYPTYFIAEIGGNFDGSLDKAKRLIDAAKEAGADCAKFQTFKAESIVSEGGFSKMTLHGVHGSWGRTVTEVFRDVEFPIEWHQEVADYCAKVGIDFSTSPYFKEAIELCFKAAMDTPDVRFVGWDCYIGENGPGIIEANDYPDYYFWQLPELTPDRKGLLPYFEKLFNQKISPYRDIDMKKITNNR